MTQVYRSGAQAGQKEAIPDDWLTALLSYADMQGDGLGVFDQQGRLIAHNDLFGTLLPKLEDFLATGPTLHELAFAIADTGLDRRASSSDGMWLNRLLHDLDSVPGETELLLADGRTIWLRLREISPFATACVLADVSQFARFDEKQQLALERADAANKAKSEFLANISHELRTPLNAIIGFSEMLASDHFDNLDRQKRGEYINYVLSSAHHLLDIINDVLDLARLESGKVEIGTDLVAVDDCIRDCIGMVSSLARKAGQQITCKTTKGLIVRTDRRHLAQIIVNLLSNAIKFTPHGGVISVRSMVGDGGNMIVSVSDTGIGMSPDELALAVQPFQQVHNGTSKSADGTGLGLSICQSLVSMYLGELAIESVKGSGTTAKIILPLVGWSDQDGVVEDLDDDIDVALSPPD